MKYISFLILFISLSSFAATLPNTIEVFGESEIEPYADTWDIHFKVYVKDKNQSSVNATYNKALRDIKETLKKLGINKKLLITESIFSSEWKEWKKNSYVIMGWKLSHSLSVHVEDLNLAGKLLSALSKIPKTSINNIRYGLKKATKKKYLNELYKNAYDNAMIKVKALISALKKRFVKVSFISEDLSSPGARGEFMAMGAEVSSLRSKSTSAKIELNPQKIALSLKIKVHAVYR